MATLTVFKFSTPEGANQMLEKVQSLQKMELIKIQDAAIVTWPQGKDKPKTKQLVSMAGIGALQGAFWGMLFGLIFFVPFAAWQSAQQWVRWAARWPITASTTISSRKPARKSPKAPVAERLLCNGGFA